MENWSASNNSGSSIHTSRVLASISGNVQNFASDSKHQLDYKPHLHTARAVSEPQYLPPSITLGSNDRQPLNDRLAFHKARRGSQPTNKVLRERPYLQNEKYLEYRKRKRQDLGKDNKPIWPDHVEASFQNALVNIPPLGRKKRTQHGKLLGRNELIREWILQETGEDRDRKQISSHVQVLSKLFEGVPEWKMVTSRTGEDNEDNVISDGANYYTQSIADQVRVLKELSSSKYDHDSHLGLEDLMDTDGLFPIQRMTFDMWVGMPDKVFKSLHNYTRISDQARPSPTIELERYENWESLFPDLRPLLEEGHVDIVLIKSRFNLMSDYPPPTSKLVLDLDLDFRGFADDPQSSSWMRYFTSVNHLYHNGERMRRSEHKDCLANEPGVVKPFFEAEWWATQFTKVTRKMKEAEQAKGLDMIKNAEAYSRNLFRGLTIMQEILVHSQHSECMTTQAPKKRVAVLLWVFAQTSKNNPGTTTWQHVTVQSQTQCSMVDDTSLPDLAMDVGIDDPFSMDMMGNNFSFDTAPMSPIAYEPGTYHSGFTPYHTSQDTHTTFDFDGVTGFTPRATSFTSIKPDPMNLIMPLNHIPPLLPSQSIRDDKVALFTLPTQPVYEDMSGPGPVTYDTPEQLTTEYSLRRDTLAHFDMSTHDMLQAQLGAFNDPISHSSTRSQLEDYHDIAQAQTLHDIDTIDIDIPLDDTIPTPDPDSQQSMIGHMNNLDLDEDSLSHALLIDPGRSTPKLMLEHPTIFESPKLMRPPLLAHNSFAGVLPDSHEEEPLHFDTPTRDEFARVISGQLNGDEGLFEDHVMDGFVMVDGHGFEPARPRSQPVLGSNSGGYETGDAVCLGSSA